MNSTIVVPENIDPDIKDIIIQMNKRHDSHIVEMRTEIIQIKKM